MDLRTRAFTKKEQIKLQDIVSIRAAIGRFVCFIAVLSITGVCLRKLNGLIGKFDWWPILTAICGFYLYRASVVLTGGNRLRELVRADLSAGYLEERIFTIESWIAFSETESEGPVWCFRDGDQAWCVSGQDLRKIDSNGALRSKLLVAVTPRSDLIMNVRMEGERVETRLVDMAFDRVSGLESLKLSKRLVLLPMSWSELRERIS